MVKRVKVALHGLHKRHVVVDADATEGAQVGRNLYWPDGSIVQQSQIDNRLLEPTSGGGTTIVGGGGGSVTLWDLILEIPAFITSLLGIGNGIVVKRNATQAVARTIEGGTGITVTNGNGVSGNPTIALDGDSAGGPWPTIKNSIEAGEAFTVPAKHQMLVWQDFAFDGGDLTLDGTLVLLAPPDPALILE